MTQTAHPAAALGTATPMGETGLEYAQMFDLAPVSLWLEDYQLLKQRFAELRAAGVTDLAAWLALHPAEIEDLARRIRLLRVNRRTLQLYEARDQAELEANLDRVFRDAMFGTFASELQQLWEGRNEFSGRSVNYTLNGKRLELQLKATVLPGHEAHWDRVLVAIEDITAMVHARQELAAAEFYARGLFEHSPVSLWVEDFSAIKQLLDGVRAAGISDFRVFTEVHPEFVERCMAEIRVIDINQATLEMFRAPDKDTLLKHLAEVFRDDMRPHFGNQLLDLWEGRLLQQREVINYRLDGETLNVFMRFSVFPGHERDWDLVLVALTDISARKKAEAYLEFLGRHDVLTKLHNRTFYVDELNRLERKGPFPVTVIMADLNGLKPANDQLGHAAGDNLLRRAGEVFTEAIARPNTVARIGGDEFAILMPGADARAGTVVMEQIQKLVEVNNTFYPGAHLSLSMGLGTARAGERLEQAIQRADQMMYRAKQAFYADSPVVDRRARRAPRAPAADSSDQ